MHTTAAVQIGTSSTQARIRPPVRRFSARTKSAPNTMMALTTQLTACTADLSCFASSGSPQVPPTAQYTCSSMKRIVKAKAR
ncbi:hypothetical protein SNOD_28780 [Streptomyces nodosus]|uniref:Uncharacterized protein n=1 Tax=Streptomyces nodosus TaxID=40318 RepID=A0A0B5DTV7_9ACTN|nr:hypothetical protein [Streptomyces nodosus]AJE43572.1 hypothetical protein SNOD_28780 [Streptomyces nodosus]